MVVQGRLFRVRAAPLRVAGLLSIVGALGPFLLRIVGSAFGMQKPHWWAGYVSTSWGLAVLAAGALAVLSIVRNREARIEALPGRLEIRTPTSRHTVHLAAVRSALVVAEGGQARLELALEDGGRVDLRVADVATAQALLDAAGLGRGRLLRVHTGQGRALLAYACATAFSVLFAGAVAARMGHGAASVFTGTLYLVGTLAAFVLATVLAPAPTVTVGADGVTIATRRGRRFVARRDVARVDEGADAVRLVLVDGSVETLALAEGDALRGRLVEALRREGGSTAAAPLLERAGRSLDAWRAALAELVDGRGYRGVSIEDVGAVLVSPTATPEQRVGAALALAATTDRGQRERVRVAAESIVDDRLRVVLEKVAGDDALEDADVEELTAPDPRSSARRPS